jgi:hypothetical protein
MGPNTMKSGKGKRVNRDTVDKTSSSGQIALARLDRFPGNASRRPPTDSGRGSQDGASERSQSLPGSAQSPSRAFYGIIADWLAARQDRLPRGRP